MNLKLSQLVLCQEWRTSCCGLFCIVKCKRTLFITVWLHLICILNCTAKNIYIYAHTHMHNKRQVFIPSVLACYLMSAPTAQVMDKVKGWALQLMTFPTDWLNYYPVMPLGVSGLINIVSSMVIRKSKLFVLCLESPCFFSHCSELHQELLNFYFQ